MNGLSSEPFAGLRRAGVDGSNDGQRRRSCCKEFKAFIARGNVLDLAVAVIIGAAFGKIVTSLTEDLSCR